MTRSKALGALARPKDAVDYGFLVHPMDLDDVAKKYAIAEKVAPRAVSEFVRHLMPFVDSRITGVRSRATGREVTGALAVVPLLPEHFARLKDDVLVDKIIAACKACARKGAGIVGLGALTADPGRGGRAVAEYMRVAVTTGTTYTVATAIEATRRAVRDMGLDAAASTLAVLGGSSPVGRAVGILMAPDFGRLSLLGRNRTHLANVAVEAGRASRGEVQVRTDMIRAVREADAVVVASPKLSGVVRPEDLRPGAVVCDVSRPREAARAIPPVRRDVLAIDGGVVRLPGEARMELDLGLPPGCALACMAETMILALEGRFEDYTLGREVAVERVVEIDRLARKHGFEVAGLRTEERRLSEREVARVKAAAAVAAPVR